MIHYVVGDATRPKAKGPWIIAHVCNNEGRWGRGFSGAVSRRWREPEAMYRDFANRKDIAIGEVLFCPVTPPGTVASMIAQWGIGHSPLPRIDYDALSTCLGAVAAVAYEDGASVHMPRIGTGNGGGSWARVEIIVSAVFKYAEVFVYDLPG